MKTGVCFLGKHNTRYNTFGEHTHGCYEMVMVLSGSGSVTVDGVDSPVSARTYWTVAPGTVHTERLDGDGEILFIGFNCCGSLPPRCGVFKTADSDTVALFDGVFDEYRRQETGYEDAIEALVTLLIVSSMRGGGGEVRQCRDLGYIRAYIEQYYYQKIDFRELAALSGYSFDHFRCLFRKKYGVSPRTCLIDTRLEQARSLLREGELSCTEVAYKCGFSNSGQFSAMYKKKFGRPPLKEKNRLV